MFKKDEKVRSELQHDCELPPEEDIVVKFINTGILVNLRRRWRHYLLLSGNNPRSKIFLRSTFIIRKERNRHLNYHYYIIHPYSKCRAHWETLMIFVILSMMIAIPTYLLFFNPPIILEYVFVMDIFGYADILINFNTGYQDMKTNKIVLDTKRIAKHYIMSWFFVDIIATLDLDMLLSRLFPPKESIFHYLMFLKALRIVTLLKYIDQIRDYYQYNVFQVKVFKLVLILFLIFLWCCTLVFITSNTLFEQHTWKYFLICSMKVVYMLLLFGSPNADTSTPVVILEIICLSIGFFIELFVVSQIIQIITKRSSSGNKYYQMTQQIEDFMRYKSLPDSIKKRILSYFDFRFQQNYYKEGEILRILSPQLRQEMLTHSFMHLLEKVHIFENLPMFILSKITYHLKAEIYLPSDVIVTAGTVGDCMYFIASGTVAVYTINGKEICHLSDGSNFGEVSLIMEAEHRAATIVAIDCCELYMLQRKDFLRLLEKYPEVFCRIRNIAQDRARKTLMSSFGADDNSSVGSFGSRLSSFRKSRMSIPPIFI